MSDQEAVLYLRISLDKSGQELGVDRQEAQCRELCARMGWTIVAVIRDNSVSATGKKARPGFEKLVAMKPKRIVMWSVDRLVRKGPDLERLIELDVPVHSVQAGPMDLATASGRLNARLLTSVATFEGEIKAERQRAAALQRAQMGKGWWPTRPFGLEFDGTLREDEAAALREAYNGVLAGATVVSLAADLNAKGMVTNKGKPWTASSLRPVLLNARNAGIRVYGGVEIGKAAWSPIVSEETYRRAVSVLTQPERRTGGGGRREAVMTGLAHCAHCGSPVRTAWRGGKGNIGSYRVYECRGKHCFSHRADWLEETVRELAIEALSQPLAGSLYSSNEGGDASSALADVVKWRTKLEELEEDYALGALPRASFLRMHSKVQDQLTEAERRRDSMVGDSPVTELVKASDVRAAWMALPLDKERAAIRWLFKSITLKRRGKGRTVSTEDHIDVEWNVQPGPLLRVV
ncbi:integrase [Streptomyces phage Verabelle]|uniref:Integrase n=1 Tax=Streptomyces phage Verabelle TaxID=3065247 RepID=A0AA50ICY4_9CAUD|nr:integrase [Streptomyces phage Verabelle]